MKSKSLRINYIKELLSNTSLVYSLYPGRGKIDKFLEGRNEEKGAIRIVYGETYDQFGMTIDSLKYYFFLSILHEILNASGLSVSSYVVVGDIASIRNRTIKDKDALLKKAKKKIGKIQKIKRIYHLQFQPILMSALFQASDFHEKIEKIKPVFQKSRKIQKIAEKTVLKNKLKQEKQTGFQYTIEEVATIIDFDLKVGPPREKHYDKIARMTGDKLGLGNLHGIYLKPTYPLGLGFDYFVNYPEIEKYGLTPYKAGSNQLQDNRVILDVTSLNKVQKLLNDSFISRNPNLPNPVLDIYIIADLAKRSLEKNYNLPKYNELLNDSESLKIKAYEGVGKYIFRPLGLK